MLVQIILTDMERRAAARLPFRVERYVDLFPEELSSNQMPVELLVAEYRLRHQYTDKPDLAEYQRVVPGPVRRASAELSRNRHSGRTRSSPGEPAHRGHARPGR